MPFTTKQQSLIKLKGNKPTSKFAEAAKKKMSYTLSENGALKLQSTGNEFLDQFGVVGNYKIPRTYEQISKDQEVLWNINPLLSVIFIFYIRCITRVVQLFDGSKTTTAQKGQGLKHEAIFRMLWLHLNAPKTFWKNIGIFVSIGSWKDIFTMLSYDLQWHGWNNRKLDWEKFGQLILTGLENPNTSELIKKYLPQIKSNTKCTTLESQADNIIAKWICHLIFNSSMDEYKYYGRYRKLKSSGTAHQWQQLISKKQFGRIDFSKIHGRALTLLVKSKFLFNQNLSDKYSQWVSKPEVKEIKSTSFVHELFKGYSSDGLPHYHRSAKHRGTMTLQNTPAHVFQTVDKQFMTAVNTIKKASNYNRWMVVRDTSGSMSAEATGSGMSCYAVAKALALFFSYLTEGEFSNNWIEFKDKAVMHDWVGNTPSEKWFNDHTSTVGNTNFQSVINLFVKLKRLGLAEEHFPEGILCISDGEFNPAQLNATNVEEAFVKLSLVFSQEYVANFKIILWNLQRGASTKFESNIKNVFFFSGYDGAIITMLSSKMKTAEELFNAAMDQEILQTIEL